MKDKTKLMIASSLTALCLVAAMLLPLCFRGEVGAMPEKESFDAGDRAELFADYWNGSSKPESSRIESVSKNEEKDCERFVQELVKRCTLDENLDKVEPEGSDYIRVSSEDGEIRICRMWMQYQGDWQNWLDVIFDMDTGDIYYLYISGECIFNGNDYLNAVKGSLDPETVAKTLAQDRGYELLSLDWSGEVGEKARAVFASEGSVIKMDINCVYYESTLIDIKICCS